MSIDTGDLTDPTYQAIMIEAEKFDHNLTIQFGLLSDVCNDEGDFIKQSKKLIKEMLTYDEVDLDDIFFGEPPETEAFHIALNKILENISRL